jgi:hypothetical protein
MRAIITALTLLTVFLWAVPASAQLRDEAVTFIANFGFGFVSPKDYDETINPTSVGLTFEKFLPGKPISLGISVGYAGAESQFLQAEENVNLELTSLPVYLGGRYVFGQGENVFYVGLGLGAQFAQFRVTPEQSIHSTNATDFSVAIPIGTYAFLSDSMFINANWKPTFVIDSEWVETFSHGFTLGLGFQFDE